jgi:hypothetical protein
MTHLNALLANIAGISTTNASTVEVSAGVYKQISDTHRTRQSTESHEAS